MNRLINKTFPVLLPVVLFIALSSTYGAEEPVEWSAPLPLSQDELLIVTNLVGSVRILGTPGEMGAVLLAVKNVEGVDQKTVDCILREMEITIERENGREVRVEARCPEISGDSGFLGFLRFFRKEREVGEARIDLTLSVPVRCDVDVTTFLGSIDVRDVQGVVRVASRRGVISIEEVQGPVHVDCVYSDVILNRVILGADVETKSGDVEAHRIGGYLNVRTSKGDIYCYDIAGDIAVAGCAGDLLVEECSGDLMATVFSGDVELIQCSGDLKVRSQTGELLIRTEPDDSVTCDLETGSGDIHMVVPGVVGAQIDARTGSGMLQCFLPLEIESITNRGIVGVAGAGEARIRIRSLEGDIRISRTD